MIFVGINNNGMWFRLEIQEAKELPEPVIDRTEYDLKEN